MKKYLPVLAPAIAILCLAFGFAYRGESLRLEYAGHGVAVPAILLGAAALLGIPSCVFLVLSVLTSVGNALARSAHKSGLPFLTVLWLGIIVIVLMCLYTPWLQTSPLPSSNIKRVDPVGYAFLWHPPSTQSRDTGIAIDYSRLLLQILAVGLVTCGLLYTVRSLNSTIALHSSPYNRGLLHGQGSQTEIHEAVNRWKADVQSRAKADPDPLLADFLHETDSAMEAGKWTPGLLDEVKGIADGAGLSYETLLAMHFLGDLWLYLENREDELDQKATEKLKMSVESSGQL